MQDRDGKRLLEKEVPDTLATNQKWYCPRCEAGYKTKSRVIVDMIVSRRAFPGVGQADPEEDNFELQEGVWSQDYIGLY